MRDFYAFLYLLAGSHTLCKYRAVVLTFYATVDKLIVQWRKEADLSYGSRRNAFSSLSPSHYRRKAHRTDHTQKKQVRRKHLTPHHNWS